MGIEPGDVVGALADNGNTLIECSLAAHEAGLHFMPLNTHLTAHELTTIMDHSGARCLSPAHASHRCSPGSTSSDRGSRVLTVGEVDGFESLGAARAAHADVGARRSAARRPVRLHVGHHRQARRGSAGRSRRAMPDLLANDNARLRPSVRLPSVRRSDARLHRHVPRRIAQLLHGRAQRRPRARDHGPVSNPSARCSSSSSTASAPPTWCRRSSTVCCSCRPRCASGTTHSSLHAVVHSAAPCPRRGQGADDGVVGPGDLGDLRRHGGRGHDRQAAPLAREARHRRPIDPRRPADHPRRRRQRGAGRRRRQDLHGERRRVQLPRRP